MSPSSQSESMPSADVLAEWVIEQAADALIYADAQGNIASWNGAATELFGYDREEAMGQSLDLIIPEHLRAAHWKGFQAAMETGGMRLQGRPTLTRAAHKLGHKLYVEMTFALVKDSSGTPIGSVAIARDVTERVEKEKAARRAASTSDEPQS